MHYHTNSLRCLLETVLHTLSPSFCRWSYLFRMTVNFLQHPIKNLLSRSLCLLLFSFQQFLLRCLSMNSHCLWPIYLTYMFSFIYSVHESSAVKSTTDFNKPKKKFESTCKKNFENWECRKMPTYTLYSKHNGMKRIKQWFTVVNAMQMINSPHKINVNKKQKNVYVYTVFKRLLTKTEHCRKIAKLKNVLKLSYLGLALVRGRYCMGKRSPSACQRWLAANHGTCQYCAIWW